MVYAQADDGTYEFRGIEPHVATITGCISSTLVVGCLLISFGLDVKLFVKWRNLLKERDSSTARHVEKGLLIYTITAFILMILISTEDALYAVASITENRELYTWVADGVYWISDFTIIASPLFLLLLSSSLRLAVLGIFARAKPPSFVGPSSRPLGGG
ncbi:hypothetical protein V3C99_008094 [Haemonchus contortus]